APELLFTENESNQERLTGMPNRTPWVKDAFHRLVVNGEKGAVNPKREGTKSAAWYRLEVPARGSAIVRLRLSDGMVTAPFSGVGAAVDARRAEADEFYRTMGPPSATEDQARVFRQALAGMFWSKQYYHFDADVWLQEHGIDPFAPDPKPIRNREWFHMVNDHVISMPDKWEYPWYAAWDLAFHDMTIVVADPDIAKDQLDLMWRAFYFPP